MRVVVPLITIMGSYRAYIGYLEFMDKIKKQNDTSKNEKIPDYQKVMMEEKVKKWMLQDLKNKMIKWKKEDPGENTDYFKFIKSVFPENIDMQDNKVIWIDKRIMGKSWVETFNKCKASDRLEVLNDPPGIS